MLLAACSEIDVVLKALCRLKVPRRKHWNIGHYQAAVKIYFPELIDEEIKIPRFGLDFAPFKKWTAKSNPVWWRSHNKVKHQRNDHYLEANLENSLNSVSALALVTLYYYREDAKKENTDISIKAMANILQPESILLRFRDEYYSSYLLAS